MCKMLVILQNNKLIIKDHKINSHPNLPPIIKIELIPIIFIELTLKIEFLKFKKSNLKNQLNKKHNY
jgi:hypothetical protein